MFNSAEEVKSRIVSVISTEPQAVLSVLMESTPATAASVVADLVAVDPAFSTLLSSYIRLSFSSTDSSPRLAALVAAGALTPGAALPAAKAGSELATAVQTYGNAIQRSKFGPCKVVSQSAPRIPRAFARPLTSATVNTLPAAPEPVPDYICARIAIKAQPAPTSAPAPAPAPASAPASVSARVDAVLGNALTPAAAATQLLSLPLPPYAELDVVDAVVRRAASHPGAEAFGAELLRCLHQRAPGLWSDALDYVFQLYFTRTSSGPCRADAWHTPQVERAGRLFGLCLASGLLAPSTLALAPVSATMPPAAAVAVVEIVKTAGGLWRGGLGGLRVDLEGAGLGESMFGLGARETGIWEKAGLSELVK